MIRRRRRGPRAAELAARWFVLLAALVGLFAMHGLSDHGTGPAPLTTASATVGTASAAAGVASDARSAPVPDDAAGAHASGTPAEATTAAGGCDGSCHAGHGDNHPGGPSGGGHDMGLMGLCLAILVAALLSAVAAYDHWWTAFRRTLGALVSRVAVTVATSRGLDPPDLHRLSIARC